MFSTIKAILCMFYYSLKIYDSYRPNRWDYTHMSRQPAGQKVNSEPHSEELAHRLVLRYFITHKLFFLHQPIF